jgi:hypothetical protein
MKRDEPRKDDPRREEPRRDEIRREEPRRDEARDYGRRFKRPPAAEPRSPNAPSSSPNPLLGRREPPAPEAGDEPSSIRRYRAPQAMQAFRPRRPAVPTAPESDEGSAAKGAPPAGPDPTKESGSDESSRNQTDTPPKTKGGAGGSEAA